MQNTPTSASSAAEPAAGSPIAKIHDAFRVSGKPAAAAMAGTWVTTRSVSPGHDDTDANGLRRHDLPDAPYAWALTFFRTAGEEMRVISVEGDAAGEMSEVDFNPEGDLEFHAGDGGNSGRKEFRCRAESATRLVCVWTGHEADSGVEFLKISK
jgi:hypothetical protein